MERGRNVWSRAGERRREKFWLCPLCNFLARRPGVCDRCKAPNQPPQPPVAVEPVAEQLTMEAIA